MVAALEKHPPAGVVDIVPAFATVALFFEGPRACALENVEVELAAIVADAEAAVVAVDSRTIEVPVCYGGESGPDLAAVATQAGRTIAEVLALHAGADYLVHAIGFAPGFPYLGGLPPELATPRRSSPRARVPAGTVGIGGAQTGIYSLETPGGWNLIGRTPLALFDSTRPEPALLRAGDRVKFRAIGVDEFAAQSAERESARGTSPGAAQRSREPKSFAVQDHPFAGVEVVRAGMFTTVQDLGRTGHRASGVPLSGAADPVALRLANLLVGNPENTAALEFTLVGPEIRFHQETLVALGGAEFGALPSWQPVVVPAGTLLKFGPARNGCRGYLAVAGGIGCTVALGSRSTYVRGGLGGWKGRTLREGDVLPVAHVRREVQAHWRIDERILPKYSDDAVVRVIAGAQAAEFAAGVAGHGFRVSPQSDRMGVRLSGAPLQRSGAGELVSSPVAPGAIQVPPDGQPIVLLADAQTIGGYPVVAHVVTVDLPVMAQLQPGNQVRFRQVTLAEAREVFAARERALGLLREGLAQKLA